VFLRNRQQTGKNSTKTAPERQAVLLESTQSSTPIKKTKMSENYFWKRYLNNYLKPGIVIAALLLLLLLVLQILGVDIYEQ